MRISRSYSQSTSEDEKSMAVFSGTTSGLCFHGGTNGSRAFLLLSIPKFDEMGRKIRVILFSPGGTLQDSSLGSRTHSGACIPGRLNQLLISALGLTDSWVLLFIYENCSLKI